MPEGYEDVTTLKSLKACKKRLDGTIIGHSDSKDATALRRDRLWYWCFRHVWVRKLPWPTHQPLVFEQKQQLGCTDCLHSKRRPLYLWWQSAKGTYICNGCYTKSEWSEIMPKGYENARFFKDLVARKTELDNLASGKTTTFSRTPSSNDRHVGPKIVHATLTRPTPDAPSNTCLPSSRKFSSSTLTCTPEERHEKLREDSALRERWREQSRRYMANLRLNPEAHRAHLNNMSAAISKRHDEDPAFRERKRDYGKHYHRKIAHDTAYIVNNRVAGILLRYPWTRTGLPWKLYLPVVTPEPIERYCTGCKSIRRKGMRLWWQKINPAESEDKMGSESFLCHACYFPDDDWAHAMPVGYEDVKSYRELVNRKKQLDDFDESDQDLRAESHIQKSNKLRGWCRRHEWVRELPWKNHRPFLLKEKVYDHCARCQRSRHRAILFWWRSLDEVLCNRCYMSGEWKDILPEGYEDVRTFNELRARKKQLDMDKSEGQQQHESSQCSHVSTRKA
jgi:hypothetical protein